ncbi:MAG: nucleotide exchange factor GrpE [Lachnospiraceae bacterium]|nr:nucleotide exchange factor GrpE [Lachnospiraceae bacterium]
MSERIYLMEELYGNMQRLATLCDLRPPEDMAEIRDPLYYRIGEKIWKDTVLCDYLSVLGEETGRIICALDETRKAAALETGLSVQYKEQLENKSVECEELLQRIEQYKALLNTREKEIRELKKTTPKAESKAQAKTERNTSDNTGRIIMDLIEMRDTLLEQKMWMESSGLDEPDAVKVINVQLLTTQRLLEKNDVVILAETGDFEYEKQTIVGTRPTADPELADKIAEVSRPGYVWKGETLRAEEVITYRYEEMDE